MKRVNKTLNIADIHFGSKNKDIGKSLNGLFEDNLEFANVHYIKLLGDVWHRQLGLGSEVAVESLNSLLLLAKFCVKNKIKFRALEGTSSHDRKQMRQFEDIARELLPELDFRYVTELSIVEEDDHTCLYVPDNLSHGTRKTMTIIKEMMREKNITKIDTCTMHGSFQHSMGFGDEDSNHSEKEFLEIINGYIVAGHIHTFQVHDRIITPGSIDRISFGESEIKGVVITHETYSTPDLNEYIFIENKRTKTFLTIPVIEPVLHLAIRRIEEKVKHLNYDSEICLVFSHQNPLFYSEQFVNHFPNLNITLKQDSVDKELTQDEEMESRSFEHIVIDETNIGLLLEDKMETNKVPHHMVKEVLETFYRKLGVENE
jgi:hypothetical protein